MSRIALGSAQFGFPYGINNVSGKVAESTVKEILNFSEQKGIDTIDTAVSYGESETCLGNAGVNNFKVVTKLPAIPNNCNDLQSWIQCAVDDSIKKLRVSYLYGLLLHSPEQLLGPDGNLIYKSLQLLVENSRVKKIGVSVYNIQDLEEITARYKLDLVQAPFNVIDRRLYTTGWLYKLHSMGIEIHSRSTFLQGLLVMAQADIPKKFAAYSDILNCWSEWLLKNNISPIHACLAFSLSFPGVSKVIVGVDSLQHLEQIIDVDTFPNKVAFPEIQSDEQGLINPSFW